MPTLRSVGFFFSPCRIECGLPPKQHAFCIVLVRTLQEFSAHGSFVRTLFNCLIASCLIIINLFIRNSLADFVFCTLQVWRFPINYNCKQPRISTLLFSTCLFCIYCGQYSNSKASHNQTSQFVQVLLTTPSFLNLILFSRFPFFFFLFTLYNPRKLHDQALFIARNTSLFVCFMSSACEIVNSTS